MHHKTSHDLISQTCLQCKCYCAPLCSTLVLYCKMEENMDVTAYFTTYMHSKKLKMLLLILASLKLNIGTEKKYENFHVLSH